MDLSDIDLSDLPENDALAFLYIEGELRRKVSDYLEEYPNAMGYAYGNYISRCIAAAEYLNIIPLADFNESPHESALISHYQRITLEVDKLKLKTSLDIRKEYVTVSLNGATRAKIHSFVAQIKVIIEELDIPEDRREALLKKLNEFSAEVDRNRTKLNALGALFVEVCTYTGVGMEKLEPVRRWIDSITKLIAEAKNPNVSIPKLPPPTKPKQIEPPPSADQNVPPNEDISV